MSNEETAAIYAEITYRVEAQRVRFADCDPLGWTTWPLALAEELGEVGKATLHRKTRGTNSVKMAVVGLAATAVRFLAWIDTTETKNGNGGAK